MKTNSQIEANKQRDSFWLRTDYNFLQAVLGNAQLVLSNVLKIGRRFQILLLLPNKDLFTIYYWFMLLITTK